MTTTKKTQSIYSFSVAVQREGISIGFPKRVDTPTMTADEARLLAKMLRAAADELEKVPIE